jgi:hypothetical protein
MRDEKGTSHFVIERPSARMLEAVLRIPVAMGKSDIPFVESDLTLNVGLRRITDGNWACTRPVKLGRVGMKSGTWE